MSKAKTCTAGAGPPGFGRDSGGCVCWSTRRTRNVLPSEPHAERQRGTPISSENEAGARGSFLDRSQPPFTWRSDVIRNPELWWPVGSALALTQWCLLVPEGVTTRTRRAERTRQPCHAHGLRDTLVREDDEEETFGRGEGRRSGRWDNWSPIIAAVTGHAERCASNSDGRATKT